MRLSSVSLLCVVLFCSVALAQHHESGSAPSAPSPSPSPSPAPSFSPPPSAPSISHSAPSAPSPASAPAMHSAPAPSPSPSPMHSSMPSSPAISNSARSAPESKPQSEVGANVAVKSAPAGKIVSEERNVETPALKKPPESDLRHPVCPGGRCPDVASEVKNPQPPKDDLRHCILCKCPPGQSGKGECVGNPTNPQPTKPQTCSAGTTWNGSSCVSSNEICPAGQSWNGVSCSIVTCAPGKILRAGACMEDCSVSNARAYALAPQVQSARMDRDDACRQGLGTAQCQQADVRYQSVLAEYRTVWTTAPAECRGPLPLPDAL
jgi:hypothetical protein